MNGTELAATTGTKSSIMGFISAHPVGVALVGGALVGLGAYYLAKKLSGKKVKEEVAAAAA
jgi:hypothetical protein